MTPAWDDRAAVWLAERLPEAPPLRAMRALAVVHDGRLAAALAFHNWTPSRGLIEISAAAVRPGWVTRPVLRAVWGYAFDVARLAVAHCGETNAPVRRLWRACGAHEAVIPGLWGPEEAGVVLTVDMDRWRASRLCRWMEATT